MNNTTSTMNVYNYDITALSSNLFPLYYCAYDDYIRIQHNSGENYTLLPNYSRTSDSTSDSNNRDNRDNSTSNNNRDNSTSNNRDNSLSINCVSYELSLLDDSDIFELLAQCVSIDSLRLLPNIQVLYNELKHRDLLDKYFYYKIGDRKNILLQKYSIDNPGDMVEIFKYTNVPIREGWRPCDYIDIIRHRSRHISRHRGSNNNSNRHRGSNNKNIRSNNNNRNNNLSISFLLYSHVDSSLDSFTLVTGDSGSPSAIIHKENISYFIEPLDTGSTHTTDPSDSSSSSGSLSFTSVSVNSHSNSILLNKKLPISRIRKAIRKSGVDIQIKSDTQIRRERMVIVVIVVCFIVIVVYVLYRRVYDRRGRVYPTEIKI